MFKKLLFAIGAVIALVIVLLVTAGVLIYVKVDKEFIAAQMSRALNRQVSIEKIDVSIFSVLSGIETGKVTVSNFKTPQQLNDLQGKPVDPADVFVSMDSFKFKVKILPLLKRRVELKEAVLYKPVVNLSKNRAGVMNIDDLLQTKKSDQPEEKEKKPAAPLSADDMPVRISIGEIGIRDATLNYYDGVYDQTIQIYALTALVHDILIDPQDLPANNEAGLRLNLGARSVGPMKSGSVRSFDIKLDVTGKVIPFDKATRLIDPEAILKIALPSGELTGLEIFNAIAAVPLLGDYLGPYIGFLKDTQKWEDSDRSGMDLRYKASLVEITNGRLGLKDADFFFDGQTNLKTRAADLNLELLLPGEVNEPVRKFLASKIDASIKNPNVKKYVEPEKLADIAVRPLLNDEQRIELDAKVTGTTNKPVIRLTRPHLATLESFVQENAGSIAVEVGKEAAQKLLREDQREVLDHVEGLFKKK